VDTNNDAGLSTDGAGEVACQRSQITGAAMAAAGAVTPEPGAIKSRMVVAASRECE
jgi:hypothetical protein